MYRLGLNPSVPGCLASPSSTTCWNIGNPSKITVDKLSWAHSDKEKSELFTQNRFASSVKSNSTPASDLLFHMTIIKVEWKSSASCYSNINSGKFDFDVSNLLLMVVSFVFTGEVRCRFNAGEMFS